MANDFIGFKMRGMWIVETVAALVAPLVYAGLTSEGDAAALLHATFDRFVSAEPVRA